MLAKRKRLGISFGVALAFLLGFFALGTWQTQRYERLRARIEDPVALAKFDRDHGELELALRDLYLVTRASSEYQQAQALESEIREQILQRTRPPDVAQADLAERNCRKLVKNNEEFPSTVDYRLFGTDAAVDADTKTITVTVDYTAKNSMGAELPYRMTCTTNYNGLVTYNTRTGR